MKTKLMKLTSLALALILLLALLPGGVLAFGPEAREEEEAEIEGYAEIDLSDRLIQFGGVPEPYVRKRGGRDALADVASERILEALRSRAPEVNLRDLGLSPEVAGNCFQGVVNEHPELFYVAGRYGISYYTDNGAQIITRLTLYYLEEYTQREIDAFDNVCRDIMAGLPDGTDEEKLLYFHDYIVTHCQYDLTYSKRNAYLVLVEGSAVCQGYMLAFKHLCNLCGLDAQCVISQDLNHGWNIVRLGEAYYYVDCTWDDPTGQDSSGTSINLSESYCKHAYFLLGKDSFAASHKSVDWINGYGESLYDYPTTTRYESGWWQGLTRPVQWVGNRMCYARPSDNSHIYFRSSGAASEESLALSGGSAYWFVVGSSTSYYSGSYITVAALDGSFYFSTPTQIWRVNGSSMTPIYTLSSAEQAKGYIYGLQADDWELRYFLAQDPLSPSVAEGTVSVAMESGYCGAEGDNVTWRLFESGTLVIDGYGDMVDYYFYDQPWSNHTRDISSLVIEPGVTRLGNSAFEGLYHMWMLSLPAGLRSIGDLCFHNCSSLYEIDIPDSVTSIGEEAFGYCTRVETIAIPAGLTSIGWAAFSECYALTEIRVSADNPVYCSDGGVLFNKAKTVLLQFPGGKEGSYTVPQGVEELAPGAFAVCLSVESVTLPEGIQRIGAEAFRDCIHLESVYYPGSSQAWSRLSVGEDNELLQDVLVCLGSDLVIRSGPQGISVHEDAQPTGVLSVSATGDGLAYQWYVRAAGAAGYTEIPGATAASCTLSLSPAISGSSYLCRITDRWGTTLESAAASVSVQAHTPAAAVRENEVAATCAAQGSYDTVVYCSVCHQELSRVTTNTDKLAHTPAAAVRENEIPATSTAEGSYDEVVYCSVCHEELSRETKTIEKLTVIPGAIAGVTVTAAPGKITVTWTDSDGAETYLLQRRIKDAAAWTTLKSNVTGLSYVDTTGVAGTVYQYRVRGRDGTNYGPFKVSSVVRAQAAK